MNPLVEAFRIGTDKALLTAGRGLYRLTNGAFPKSMFSMTVKTKQVPTNVRIISGSDDEVTIAKVDENGHILDDGFRILSTTDLHLGDDPALRQKCFQMLMNHINATRPDLVVLTGDIILSKFQHIDAIQFAQFMEKIGVYWAFVFGNHEAREEKGDFKFLLMECMTKFPHCLTRQGKPELFGYGNFCINILKNEHQILKSLFLLDSGRNIRDEYRGECDLPANEGGYDFIKQNQKDWYREKLMSLRAQYGEVKSFLYLHIPLKEYEYAIREDENGDYVFTDTCKILYGSAYESVGSSPYNSGMFALMKELGSTEAVFSGHDHVNDYCALYDGVYLVYNQCGGYETYTMADKKGWDESEWMQGVTITDIEPDGAFDISPRYSKMYLE